MPFFVVYSRSVPRVVVEFSISGTPKAWAKRSVSGLLKSARILRQVGTGE